MIERNRGSMLYRTFRRDIGRKLTALACAVILYGILDGQIQDTSEVTLPIEFIDELDLQAERFSLERKFLLYVVERSSDPPIIVAPSLLHSDLNFTLRLHGPKTALQDVQRSGIKLFYELHEGQNRIQLEDVEGIRDFEKHGVAVEWSQEPPVLVGVKELEESVKLKASDVTVAGDPAPGQSYRGRVEFSRAEVPLVGPETEMAKIRAEDRDPLFEPVYIEGARDRVSIEILRLDLNLQDAGVRYLRTPVGATLTLETNYVPLKQSTFDRSVQVMYYKEALGLNANKFHAAGQKLRFEDDARRFQLVFEVPEEKRNELEQLAVNLAKEKVMLEVYAHEAKNETDNHLQVNIKLLPGFPEDWRVKFVEPEPIEVTASWEEEKAPDSTSESGKNDNGEK